VEEVRSRISLCASAPTSASTSAYVPHQSASSTCTHAPMHLCTYAPMHLCTYTPMHLCTYAPIHLCTYAPIHLFTYALIHLYTYTPMHLYTYTPIHLCTYILTFPISEAPLPSHVSCECSRQGPALRRPGHIQETRVVVLQLAPVHIHRGLGGVCVCVSVPRCWVSVPSIPGI
jgi:hypothetical protein